MGCIYGHDNQGYRSFHIWFLCIQTGIQTSCGKNGLNKSLGSFMVMTDCFDLNLALFGRIPSGKLKLQGCREKMDKYLDYRCKPYNVRLVDKIWSSYCSLVGQVVVEKLEQWIRSLICMGTGRNVLQWKWRFIIVFNEIQVGGTFWHLLGRWRQHDGMFCHHEEGGKQFSPHCFWGQMVSGRRQENMLGVRHVVMVWRKTAWWSRVKA